MIPQLLPALGSTTDEAPIDESTPRAHALLTMSSPLAATLPKALGPEHLPTPLSPRVATTRAQSLETLLGPILPLFPLIVVPQCRVLLQTPHVVFTPANMAPTPLLTRRTPLLNLATALPRRALVTLRPLRRQTLPVVQALPQTVKPLTKLLVGEVHLLQSPLQEMARLRVRQLRTVPFPMSEPLVAQAPIPSISRLPIQAQIILKLVLGRIRTITRPYPLVARFRSLKIPVTLTVDPLTFLL